MKCVICDKAFESNYKNKITCSKLCKAKRKLIMQRKQYYSPTGYKAKQAALKATNKASHFSHKPNKTQKPVEVIQLIKSKPLQLTRDEAVGIEKKLVSHLLPRKERSGEQNLQIEIIMQAVRDLRKDDEKLRYEARGFLCGHIGDVEHISTLAGIDHSYIKRVINTVYASRAPDQELEAA